MVRLLAATLLVMCQATLAATAPAAVKAASGASPPAKIRLCDADNPGWCWTYTRNGDHYDGVGDRGGSRTMTLETFTSESVVMRMTQAGRPGWYSVNSGKISSDGGSITSGVWSDSNGGKGHITATWEAAAATESPAKSKAAAAAPTRTSTTAEQKPAAKPAATKAATKAETPKVETTKSEASAHAAKPAPVTKPVVLTKPAGPAEPEK